MNNHLRSHLQRPSSSGPTTPVTGILKRTVSARLTREFGEHLPPPLFRRALDEAEAVAHATGFGDLFFPTLAEEKIRLVSTAVRDSPFVRSVPTPLFFKNGAGSDQVGGAVPKKTILAKLAA